MHLSTQTQTWGFNSAPPGRLPMIFLHSVFYINLPSELIVDHGSLYEGLREVQSTSQISTWDIALKNQREREMLFFLVNFMCLYLSSVVEMRLYF